MRRKTTFFIFGVLFSLILFSTGTNSQNDRKNEILAMEGQVARVLSSSETTVRRFNPDKIKSNQIAIRVEYNKLNLSEKDLKKYATVSRNIIARVDYVTARCANDVYYASNAVDKQRVEALYSFNKKFFINKKITWGKIVQTGCNFDYESQNWWYGFVITLKSVTDGKGHFIEERIKDAIENEFREGDMLEEILRLNNGDVKPPTTFRTGHVNLMKQLPNLKQKTSDGYILTMPSKSPIPTPVICDGKIFVSGGFQSTQYYAFTPEDGEIIWGANLSDNGPSSAACSNGRIIINTESCTIFIIDAITGEQLWSYFLGDPLISTPSADQKTVYTVYPAPGHRTVSGSLAPTHVIGAFDLETGTIKWQKWIDSDIITSPVVVGKELYATSHAGIVYRFNTSDGTITAAYRARATSRIYPSKQGLFFSKRSDQAGSKGVLESLALYDHNFVQKFSSNGMEAGYLEFEKQDETDFANQGIGLDQGNGFHGGAPVTAHAEAGYVHLGRKSVSTLQAFEGSHILVTQGKAIGVFGTTVKAYDILTKMELWKIDLPVQNKDQGGNPLSAPSIASGSLFVATLDGKIIQININNGMIQKTYTTSEPLRSQPLLYKGKIYAPTVTGKLIVIDTGDPSVTGYTTWMQSNSK